VIASHNHRKADDDDASGYQVPRCGRIIHPERPYARRKTLGSAGRWTKSDVGIAAQADVGSARRAVQRAFPYSPRSTSPSMNAARRLEFKSAAV